MKNCKVPGIRVALGPVGFRGMGWVAPARVDSQAGAGLGRQCALPATREPRPLGAHRSLATITLGALILLTLALIPSPVVAQRSKCWICEPVVLLEPASFVRNLDANPDNVDLLARIHIMAPTGIPRLGVSLVTQWVAPHGSSPMIMAHVSYTVLQRPFSVAPFLGMMNVRFQGRSVIKPMTALYVTVPTGLPQVRFYALWTLLLADDVIPSLAVGLRIPFAPLPAKGGM